MFKVLFYKIFVSFHMLSSIILHENLLENLMAKLVATIEFHRFFKINSTVTQNYVYLKNLTYSVCHSLDISFLH